MSNATPEQPKSPRASASLPSPKMRRGLKTYFAEVSREMKKVTWPTIGETNRLFGVVMAVTVLLVTVLSGLGYFFDQIVTFITRGAA